MKKINILRLEAAFDEKTKKLIDFPMAANKEIKDERPQEIHKLMMMTLPELMEYVKSKGYQGDETLQLFNILGIYPLIEMGFINRNLDILDESILEVREMKYVRIDNK